MDVGEHPHVEQGTLWGTAICTAQQIVKTEIKGRAVGGDEDTRQIKRRGTICDLEDEES